MLHCHWNEWCLRSNGSLAIWWYSCHSERGLRPAFPINYYVASFCFLREIIFFVDLAKAYWFSGKLNLHYLCRTFEFFRAPMMCIPLLNILLWLLFSTETLPACISDTRWMTQSGSSNLILIECLRQQVMYKPLSGHEFKHAVVADKKKLTDMSCCLPLLIYEL